MPGTDLTMVTSDGVTLAYDDEGGGRPVVLLHGYSGRRANFEFQRDALLEAGYRVIALDARGHGASETPSHGQTMARLGQDTRELLELLELEDVALIGHSMGVSVALAMFTISGFDRIERFVAIDQSAKIINDEDWTFGVKQVSWANAYDCVHFRAEWGTPAWNRSCPKGVRRPSRGRTLTTTQCGNFSWIISSPTGGTYFPGSPCRPGSSRAG